MYEAVDLATSARSRVLIFSIGTCDVTHYVVHSVQTTNQFEGDRIRLEHSKSCEPNLDEQENERDESQVHRCGS